MPFARWHDLEQSLIVCDGVVVGSGGWVTGLGIHDEDDSRNPGRDR